MDWKTSQTPPAPYREIPFWSWNDRLEAAELRRQIGEMERAGWGGFFMHARVGLRTPYLGPQWLECVRACVEEARVRGMGAWLYDEDKWPSGFAGGLSVTAHPEYRAQALICKVDDRPALLAERIATFAAREVAGQRLDRYAPEFRVDDRPTQVIAHPGPDNLAVDLTAQGLPFFAGRATLRQQVELPSLSGPVFLEVSNLRAAVAHVAVNGQRAGAVAWPPLRVEVTAHVRPGVNEIAVELVGTLRNLLGPHHLAGGDRESTGPIDLRLFKVTAPQ